MSFMPSTGSLVRLKDGCVAVVTKVTPLGEDDRVACAHGVELRVTADDITEVLWERE